MSDLAKVNNYSQRLIDNAGKENKYNLDFLEGFVYALLLVQGYIKEVSHATNKEEDSNS